MKTMSRMIQFLMQLVSVNSGINSKAPRKQGSNFKSMICEHISRIKFICTFFYFTPMWMPQNKLHGKPTLVQITPIDLVSKTSPEPMPTQIFVGMLC